MSIVISLSFVAITSYFHNNLRGSMYHPLRETVHAKFRKRDGHGVEDAKSRECGIQQQIQVKNWGFGRRT